jgi:hypothetical protein
MTQDLLLQCASDKMEEALSRWAQLGFRFGDKGTHTSRTIMLDELNAVLAHCPPDAPRSDYTAEIIEHNLLGKRTASTRRLTNQRLGELYGGSFTPKANYLLNFVLDYFRVVPLACETSRAKGRRFETGVLRARCMEIGGVVQDKVQDVVCSGSSWGGLTCERLPVMGIGT